MAAVTAVAEVVAMRRAVAGDSTAVVGPTAGFTAADTRAGIAVGLTAEAPEPTPVAVRPVARPLANAVPALATRGHGKGTALAIHRLAGISSHPAVVVAWAGAVADPWLHAQVNRLSQGQETSLLMPRSQTAT